MVFISPSSGRHGCYSLLLPLQAPCNHIIQSTRLAETRSSVLSLSHRISVRLSSCAIKVCISALLASSVTPCNFQTSYAFKVAVLRIRIEVELRKYEYVHSAEDFFKTLTVAKLVKKFLVFYRTRKFMTASTTASFRSLS